MLDPAALRLKRSLHLAMFPSSVTLKRYRCFEEEQTLPVRRITLIYGENNTGKSALVRLLPLLADSCDARSTAPLNEESKAMRGSSFLSQFWHEEREGLELALSWEDLTARYAFSVREDGTHQSGRIERCVITRGGDLVAEATLHRGPRDEQKLGTHVWRVGSDGEFRGSFRGLIPDVPPDRTSSIVAQLRAHTASCDGSVQWLHARRMPLRSEATALVGPQWQIMPDGSDVIRFLSSQPAVVDRVRAWFGHHQKLIFDVSRESQSKSASLVLRDSHARGWGTNMADGSEGLQFTVPVLASLGLISMKVPEAPKVLALEEPEGHLHGRLQRALAEEIIDVVERTPDARVVIETHSPIFLTALQLAIVTAVRRAQHAGAPPHPLAPSEVAVCLLERAEGACAIRTLDLDEEGAPRTSELMDFFSEEHAIASDLRRARSER